MYFKNKSLQKDLVLMAIIVISPFAFFLYNSIPENIQQLNTPIFDIYSGHYYDVNQLIWTCSVIILTLIILSIWFITCTFKWRWVLFVPIFMEIKKLHFAILVGKSGHDIYLPILHSFIFAIPYIIVLILIDIKVGYYKKNMFLVQSMNEEINSEMNKLAKFSRKDYREVEKSLKVLESKKSEYELKEYLIKIISLRDRLNEI